MALRLWRHQKGTRDGVGISLVLKRVMHALSFWLSASLALVVGSSMAILSVTSYAFPCFASASRAIKRAAGRQRGSPSNGA